MGRNARRMGDLQAMTAETEHVALVGGSSQVARFVVPRLVRSGRRVDVYSRSPPPWQTSVPVDEVSLHEIPAKLQVAGRPAALIWLPPLLLLPPLLEALAEAGVRRIVAFGTTAMFYKALSPSVEDREFARRTQEAEAALEAAAVAYGLAWTVLRPTMTYGCARDDNVTKIANTVRKLRCFPLVGRACGLRQPVHADDLAAACVAVLDNPLTFGKAYSASGGETLSYREIVVRVFHALDRVPVLVSLPEPVLRGMIALLRRLPRYRGLSPDMAKRMQRDLCFDHVDAATDFGYSPRPFHLDAEALGLVGPVTTSAKEEHAQ